jgi:tRNA A58 N-methylase Trm61
MITRAVMKGVALTDPRDAALAVGLVRVIRSTYASGSKPLVVTLWGVRGPWGRVPLVESQLDNAEVANRNVVERAISQGC